MKKASRIERRTLVRCLALTGMIVAAGVWSSAQAQAKPPQRPTDAKLIAAGKADATLTVYTASSATALKADAEAFEKAYGIKVSYTQMTSGPMAARVDQEIKAGRINADLIVSADTTTLYRWVAGGYIGKLPDVPFPDRTEFIAPIQTIYQSLFYNTAGVAKADIPKTWNDLLKPKFTGKIVIGSPRIGTAYATQYYALLKDPNYGEAFFQKLALQKPRIVATPALVAQLTASGEALVAFNGIPYDAANIVTANPGAPIAYTYLDPITTARTYVAINAKAQKPNAAKLFAAWLMSVEGQTVHNGENRASSLLGNLPGTLAAPDPARVRADYTVNKTTIEYQNIINMFDRTFK
jgi:iron(III) transport system substrate-binding protein